MYLWLDDIRKPPDDSWTWVKTVDDAMALLREGNVEFASLDHDLGMDPAKFEDYTLGLIDEADAEITGYQFTLLMAEFDLWPSKGTQVHSMNPVGADRICGVIDRYGPYSEKTRRVLYSPV